MELDVGNISVTIAQLGVAAVLLKVLLKRDEDDRSERQKRDEADRQERRERLDADKATTAALTTMAEVLRGVGDAVERISR